ncbi:MAG: S8 family serine peptidase [Rudaea sp.]|uniref:S8 family serine peptidase n=1 Tax=Rudaea sp. TaxID=2136325 RepID=UPI0039E22EB6
MKTRTYSALRPLACALALTLGSGLSSVPMSRAAMPSLRAATALAPTMAGIAGAATAAKANPNVVKEQGGKTGQATRAARVAPLDENGRARYFVILDGEPVASTAGLPMVNNKKRKDMHSEAALSRVAALQAQQTSFVSSISSTLGRTIAPLMQYQYALNAVLVELTPEEAATVAAQSGVLKVNRETVKEIKTYNTHTLIGADTIWAGTSTPNNVASYGEGTVIGEIDTGINWTSKSFAATGDDNYTVTNPLGTGVYMGNCLASGTTYNGYKSNGKDVGHCNDKLIGIYNTEYSSTSNPSSANYNPASGQDLDGHGSHTTSTGGGNVVYSAPYGGGTFNVSGVAPHANVIAYLACGTQTYSCYDSGLAAAYNQAVADGIVDAINYSIGGPEDSPWSSTIQLAALSAMDAGIFVAQAAGNDGPTASSIDGNESPWTTTVAASSPAKIVSYSFSLTSVDDSTDVPAATQGLAAIPGSAPLPTQAYTGLPLIVSPGFANGDYDGCASASSTNSPYSSGYFTRNGVGGIAVLHLDQNTSTCGSAYRQANAVAAGATAVVFVDDNFISLGATGASYSLLTSAWNAILATSGIDVTNTGNATASLGYPVSANSRTPDLVTTYSSRGPIAFNELKPDITAPGDNVLAAMSPTSTTGYSTANQAASSVIYGVESGTSMATPHITGSAALVRAIHPDWTPMQIKSALMSTSTTAYTNDGSEEADPIVVGAGRVDLTKATLASLLFDETKANFVAADPDEGGDPATLNLASYYAFNCVGSCVFTRTPSSALSTSGSWTIAVTGLPAGSYSLDKTSLSLAAGGSDSYTLTIDATQLTAGQWYYGKLTLTSSDSTLPVQHLPIAIRAATAALRASPSSLSTHAAVGQTVTQPVTISNAGNPGLNWSIPTDTLKATLVNQPYNTGYGYPDITVATSTTTTAIQTTNANNYYDADYFDIYGAGTTLAEVAVHGFGYYSSGGTYPSISTFMTQLALRVWADNGSNKPNGRPGNTVTGDVDPVFQFPSAAGGLGPTNAGISYPGTAGVDDIIDLDLAAAGATAPGMAAGRYWLTMTPTISGTSMIWYRGPYQPSTTKSVVGQVSLPNATSSTNKAWRAMNTSAIAGSTAFTGWAMKIVVNAACSASWLSYDSTSGTLGLDGSTTVNVSFNATGLAVGTYKAYVCVSGNGTSPTNDFTSDDDSILIPVTFTVVAAPSSPSCTASPNPANVDDTVTFTCSGADVGTTNTIPDATCSPNPTTDGTFTCTGTAGDIGANPTLTSSTAAGDSATVPLSLEVQVHVATSVDGSGGSIADPASVDVDLGGAASFTAVPDTDYSLYTVAGDSCSPTVSGNTISVDSATANCTITVTFVHDPVDGVCGSDNGQVLTVPPTNLCSAGTAGAVSGSGPWTWQCVGEYGGATVDCSTSAQTWTVTATVDGSGGSVTSTNPVTVNDGDTASFTVTPDSHYALSGASGCDATFSGNTITTGAITADCTVTVTFSRLTGYVALNPKRILDTRATGITSDGLFQAGGVLSAGDPLDLIVLGRGGIPADGVKAVALNITATNPTRSSYVTAWPSGADQPIASNLNFSPGQTIANLVIIKVGDDGAVSLVNGIGSADLIADVQGYFTDDADLTAVQPARLLDTRTSHTTIDGNFAGEGALAAQVTRPLTVTGRDAELPASGIGSVILNVTATNTTAAGHVTVWSTDNARPNASNLNFVANQTIPNLVIAQVGTDGAVSMFNSAGSTDLVADVMGWFPTGSELTPLQPARLLDTRANGATIDGQLARDGAVGAGQTKVLPVLGRGGVPASGVNAVVLNVTVTQPTHAGYITAWPTGSTQPIASNVNFVAGQTIPNLVIVKVGTGGDVSLFNAQSSTHLVVDVVGWFAAE